MTPVQTLDPAAAGFAAGDGPEAAALAPARLLLLNRDHSILAFNERVLDWAVREDVPLLERLRYLCIVSSNLDEFFEVRAAAHLAAARAAQAGETADDGYGAGSFEALSLKTHALVARQYALYNDSLMPAFAAHGIRIVSHGERTLAQRRWVREYFRREVRPLLIPVGLDPAHPFPQVANKSLNFIVRLRGGDAFGRENEIAIVKVPRALPRLMRLPAGVAPTGLRFVSLSSIIRTHLAELFPGRQVCEFSQFRVTRHSDLAVDEDDVRNLRTALRQGLQHRHYGQAVRLEVSAGCSPVLADFLQTQFALPAAALYRVHGPVNLVRMGQLVDLVDDAALLFTPWRPAWPARLPQAGAILARLRRRDVLIHQPFESFDGVLAFLREAVGDPQVLAIKQTIYRTGADSELMELLREAVHRGKEVTAVVELKARFDEEANINWAEALESIGAQVVYGVVGLKTHAKMLLVTRREGSGLRRYGHLSTGNYNPRTARLYTDLSYLTADEHVTADMDAVFDHLANQNRLPKLRRLLLAPFELQRSLIGKIDAAGLAAERGEGGRIVAKMNALTDEDLIRALVRAGQRGARIDLIVRGACMLPARVPGITDNIRVRSVIGRFLEHTRVFYFCAGAQEELYLASADWMNRNMLRREEIAWPVTDRKLRQRIIDECLVAYLHDDRDAWTLEPDGRYARAPRALDGAGAQNALMARYAPSPASTAPHPDT
ncbi:MAG: RNA degradosome polyphosphate kinase [Burkholderiales bacterium 66-5]|uniref:polyphosphate kinase 1 n=1 Tax=Comamonas sp. SCN 65-56 TaxID=1660095 RepID=UPI00086F3273|nr:polyphosphate kinase 1 [Comamonas sp. SCN 65-56]ODS90473.1 MAG: RNA degradosome polyphosphate kinase [Comamonas sp. SCN 65-56]OJU92746.1 MAG: RNA degradosome polyphosphate kinase [Burkholderiales bacterium 66-5]